MKRFTTDTQKIGEIGENIACRFLMKHNFVIVDRNYSTRNGEIDIICLRKSVLHFIEVKSCRCHSVSCETYSASENMTKTKIFKIKKTVFDFLRKESVSHETFQIDLVVVQIFSEKQIARVSYVSKII